MSSLEQTYSFTGDTGWIIVAILCCPPFGVYYYLDNREEVVVCPECKETVSAGASTCSYCNEELDQYR
jgi:hypothetical protein